MGLSFLSFGQEGDVKKKLYDVGGYEKKNAPFKISSALPHFSKHNKCSLVLAIKETVSLLRERINADQEWRS